MAIREPLSIGNGMRLGFGCCCDKALDEGSKLATS